MKLSNNLTIVYLENRKLCAILEMIRLNAHAFALGCNFFIPDVFGFSERFSYFCFLKSVHMKIFSQCEIFFTACYLMR